MRSTVWQRDALFAVGVVFLLCIAPLGGCASSQNNGSIGVVLGHDKRTGALHVRDTPPGLAGDKAGLHDGDRIKMIDGMLVDRLPPERVRELLRGPVGSRVTLTVIRGAEVLHLEVTRERLGTKAATSAKAVE